VTANPVLINIGQVCCNMFLPEYRQEHIAKHNKYVLIATKWYCFVEGYESDILSPGLSFRIYLMINIKELNAMNCFSEYHWHVL
jgi:hypothetical protein